LPSIAIESHLVDDLPATAPVGFARVRVSLAGGLPRELALGDGWSVILQVPTGVATTWLDSDAAAIVSASELERVPYREEALDAAARCAPRLVARHGGAPLAAIPLVAGVTTRVRDSAALLEVVPLAWELRAGAMRGAAGHPAHLELAWRSHVALGGGMLPVVAASDAAARHPSRPPGGGPRVVVVREDDQGRNIEFLDTVTGRRMTVDEFIKAIRDQKYPDYVVRMMHGRPTPVSRGNETKDDNLG